MRTIAEEKRSGTFELLATSPLSIIEIVLGKFMGVAFVIVVMCLLAFLFPLLLISWANPEVKPVISGLVALMLTGLSFVSVGMAVSSFTQNQIVAGVSSMVALLLLYVIHSPAESIGGTTGAVLQYLSPLLQGQNLVKGVVPLDSLVYFFSIIFLGLTVSQRVLEGQRWR